MDGMIFVPINRDVTVSDLLAMAAAVSEADGGVNVPCRFAQMVASAEELDEMRDSVSCMLSEESYDYLDEAVEAAGGEDRLIEMIAQKTIDDWDGESSRIENIDWAVRIVIDRLVDELDDDD